MTKLLIRTKIIFKKREKIDTYGCKLEAELRHQHCGHFVAFLFLHTEGAIVYLLKYC